MSKPKESETVLAWTDGSCRGNPGPGGWGVLLRMGDKERELAGGESVTTNNRMELMAAIVALETLKRPVHVVLHSDSQYVVKGMSEWIGSWAKRHWKNVANVDLWKRLVEAAKPHEVEWRWVRGHAGDKENERVDKLATQEADRAGEKDSVAVRVDLEGRLEVECALAGVAGAEKKAPPYCVRGPGNTGLHCVVGSGEHACPHAFVVLERSKLKLTDRAGGSKTIETDESGKGPKTDELRSILRSIGTKRS